MHKSYNYKTVNVISAVFNALLFLGFFMAMLAGISTSIVYYYAILTIGGVGTLVSGILMFRYYSNKEQSTFVLIKGLFNIIFAVFIFIFYKTGLMLSGFSYSGWFTLSMIISLVSFVADLFVILRLDGKLHIENFDHMLPSNTLDTVELNSNEDGEVQTSTDTPTVAKEPVKIDFAGFFKSSAGKAVIAVIAVAIIAFAGYKVWDNFFNYTVIDAFNGLEVEFDGYDGEGTAYAHGAKIDYDLNDYKLSSFIYSISYDVENNNELSNEDKVKITLSYSEETAKSLKIKFKEESKAYEVSGLKELYKDAASIDPELLSQATKDVDDYVQGDKEGAKLVKVYYVYPETRSKYTSNSDYQLYFIYEVKEKNWNGEEVTVFYRYNTTFNSDYTGERLYLYGVGLRDDNYEYIKDEKDILKGLEKAVDDSKAKIEEVKVD